jgi:hypothetical protein
VFHADAPVRNAFRMPTCSAWRREKACKYSHTAGPSTGASGLSGTGAQGRRCHRSLKSGGSSPADQTSSSWPECPSNTIRERHVRISNLLQIHQIQDHEGLHKAMNPSHSDSQTKMQARPSNQSSLLPMVSGAKYRKTPNLELTHGGPQSSRCLRADR